MLKSKIPVLVSIILLCCCVFSLSPKFSPFINKNADCIEDEDSSIQSVNSEMRAVWVSFSSLDMAGTDYSEEAFKQKFDNIVSESKKRNINALIVHVRPFSDALYKSKFYPWSHLVSGTQGADPGYDPLKYMIKACHKAGLQFHAWVNPLRIQLNKKPSLISADNKYNLWKDNDNTKKFVMEVENNLYFNPAYSEVRELIINGVKEIVENYNVDGIHFDDYFYPTSSSDYNQPFYNEYIQTFKNNFTPLSIDNWKISNINSLITGVYSTIKSIKKDVVFGISPAANVANDLRMGADVFSWSKCTGFVDYICPQVYFNFENEILPFDKSASQWREIVRCKDIKLYYGLGMYKAGSDADNGTWKNSDDILKRQVEYCRNLGCDGFMLFSFDDFNRTQAENEITNVLKVLN